jgi:hypothetical protein
VLLGSGLTLLVLWQILPTYGEYGLAELLGAFGTGLLASGLLLVTISLSFGPSVRRRSLGEESRPKWGRKQSLALIIVSVILLVSFNTLYAHVGLSSDIYDEQIAMTFSSDLTRMDVNVSAVEQIGTSGSGPAYLLNGLSNASYWYQVGVLSNWGGPRLGCGKSFEVGYAVFAPNGTEILPARNSSNGVMLVSLRVHQGDTILLSMFFSDGNVVMQAHDWNTGASSEQRYSAFGANHFRGIKNWVSYKGFFTGVMTEQYHDSYYYGGEETVRYSWSNNLTQTSAWMWVDEYVPPSNHNQTIFFAPAYVNYNQTQSQNFVFNGAYAVSTQHQFVTGQLDVNPPSPRWICSILGALGG